MKPVGIFGGTFDPVHYGHLRSAFELLHAAQLSEVRFVPCGVPPHRAQPVASADVRLAMVKAAVADQPGLTVDARELERAGPSYSIDTLESFRSELGDRPMCLLVGMDAYLGLPNWHRWRSILDVAHLVVAHRPGWPVPADGLAAELMASRGVQSSQGLTESPAGAIYVHEVTQLEISSSGIRDIVAQGGDPRFLVPEGVRLHMARTGCYINDASQEQHREHG